METNSKLTDRSGWIKRAIYLSWFTIIYNFIEGVVSIYFGASDDSISLMGFGIDSLIEVASAFLILWRFKGDLLNSGEHSDLQKERYASRGIGLLFIGLACFTLISSGNQLISSKHPATTLPGLIVSFISLSFMFYLWSAKRKVATALDSAAMAKDAECSRACIQLSVILFLGSILFAVFPTLWWADGVAGCILSFFIGKEGVETVKGSYSEEFEGGCGCG